MRVVLRFLPRRAGELWLGGIGVARDYLNRPDLTKTNFVKTSEGLFYRSGDYGRWSKDGRIEIIGRIDHQVKSTASEWSWTSLK